MLAPRLLFPGRMLQRFGLLLCPLVLACGGAPDPLERGAASINPGGLPVGSLCADHAECESDACGYAGLCVARRSEVVHAGGDTCGPGEEEGEHESCARTLSVPLADGSSAELDKYVITAGRMRAFVERTGGDLRSFVNNLGPDPRWDPTWTERLPSTMDELYDALGPWNGNGCYFDGEGARTYWLPDAVNQAFPDSPHQYSQDVLDQKAMNCVSFYLLQAFCIWDGGRLASLDELYAAWGSATYPWGEEAWDETRVVHNFNYAYPAEALDRTSYVSAPGRRPAGNGPYGHADLAGLLFQISSSVVVDDIVSWSRSGSFEGHEPGVGWTDGMARVYWAAGGRCTYLGQ